MLKNKYTIIALVVLLFIVLGVTIFISLQRRVEVASFKPITLEYWGVWERPEDIEPLTKAYNERHPLITIHYRTFRPEEYAQKLLEAWAVDQGPDVFMIPNSWLRQYQKYLTPMPAQMRVPAKVVQGTLKKQLVDIVQTSSGYTGKDIKDKFLDVVYQDVVADNQIYGLPLSVETLALFYNRGLLLNSGIPEPAQTWTDIINQTPQISRLDANGQLIQSTVALGTTTNVPNAFDIISLLLLQQGVNLEANNQATFANDSRTADVINFYLSFAKSSTLAYSWNKDQANALDAFTAGKLAYFLGYNFHVPLIEQANPKLDWDILPAPQFEGASSPLTYANYWVNAVAKKSQNNEVAWQFIKEITSADNVQPYLTKTGKTTALLSLVNEQKNDIKLAPFANLLLTAKSWYHGYDFATTQKLFLDMADKLASSDENAAKVLLSATANQISQTYKKPTE